MCQEIQGTKLSDLISKWATTDEATISALDKMQLLHQSLVEKNFVDAQRPMSVKSFVKSRPEIETAIMALFTANPEQGRSFYFADASITARILRDIGLDCFSEEIKTKVSTMFPVKAKLDFIIRSPKDGPTVFGIRVDSNQTCDDMAAAISYLDTKYPNEHEKVLELIDNFKLELQKEADHYETMAAARRDMINPKNEAEKA